MRANCQPRAVYEKLDEEIGFVRLAQTRLGIRDFVNDERTAG